MNGTTPLVPLATTTTTVFYLPDERGNTAMRLDRNGAILSSHVTDAFGATKTSDYVGSSTDDPFAGFGGSLGYSRESGLDLYRCGLRFYDVANARWLTRDPIGYGGGQNLYGYVSGNPVMAVDPAGMDAGWARSGQGPYGDQHVVGGRLFDHTDAIIEIFGGPKLPGTGIGSPAWNQANSNVEQMAHTMGWIYAYVAPRQPGVRSTGIGDPSLNSDGFIELYHYTSGKAAQQITQTEVLCGSKGYGMWLWRKGDVYLTTDPKASTFKLTIMYGLSFDKQEAIIPVRVPAGEVIKRPGGIRIIPGPISTKRGY